MVNFPSFNIDVNFSLAHLFIDRQYKYANGYRNTSISLVIPVSMSSGGNLAGSMRFFSMSAVVASIQKSSFSLALTSSRNLENVVKTMCVNMNLTDDEISALIDPLFWKGDSSLRCEHLLNFLAAAHSSSKSKARFLAVGTNGSQSFLYP